MKKLLRGRGARIGFSLCVILFAAVFAVLIGSYRTSGQVIEIIATLPSVCPNNIADFDEQCDGSALRGRTCADFGYATGTLGCAAGCEWSFSSCVTESEVLSDETFVFTAGGTHIHTTASGTQAIFDVPQDFQTKDLTLHSFSYANNFFSTTKPAPSGKSFVGKVYDFVFFDFYGEPVSTLLKEVTITVEYLSGDISGLDEDTIKPYRFDTSDSTWQEIPASLLNKTNKRVSFSTNTFSSFALFASAAAAEEPAPAPSGGGGGGGGFISPETGVRFSGMAYPASSVTVLRNGQIAATTIAGSNAAFDVNVSGLTAGSYVFSLYSEDKDGVRSSLSTFPVSVSSGSVVHISGIFIAPSLEVNLTEVRRGDNITIFGQSAPSADILITVGSEDEFFARTAADTSGVYLYRLNTAFLEMGSHTARARASIGALLLSGQSRAVIFTVGTRNVPKVLRRVGLIGDLNEDSRVNLIDFSIMTYWYRRASPPAHVDLNADGVVDLRDFSIMAYHWTG